MADGDRMPKVDLKKDQLTGFQKEYMQRVQEQNLERAKKWSGIRRNNRYVGIGLGCLAISIYGYSMWAIKQEKFLDDFEEPEKVVSD